MPDLFEQLVGDYLTAKGYLCKFNVNYRKADGRQSGSDIDVLAKRLKRPHDVVVGDCKSWVDGVWTDWTAAGLTKSAKDQQYYFKAIFDGQWSEGLKRKVQEECGTSRFTYVVYCARLRDSGQAFRNRSVAGNPIQVVTLAEIVREAQSDLEKKSKHTNAVEPTTLSRFVQLMRHAGIKLEFPQRPA